MINKENCRKLADFIEDGTHRWDISFVENCLYGQYSAMVGCNAREDGDKLFPFLGFDEFSPVMEKVNLTTPRGWCDHDNMTSFSRAAAVAMLRNLADTGKVVWK